MSPSIRVGCGEYCPHVATVSRATTFVHSFFGIQHNNKEITDKLMNDLILFENIHNPPQSSHFLPPQSPSPNLPCPLYPYRTPFWSLFELLEFHPVNNVHLRFKLSKCSGCLRKTAPLWLQRVMHQAQKFAHLCASRQKSPFSKVNGNPDASVVYLVGPPRHLIQIIILRAPLIVKP